MNDSDDFNNSYIAPISEIELTNLSLLKSIVSIWTIGISFSLLNLVLVFMSKPKLLKVEFSILVFFTSWTLLYKIFSSIQFLSVLIDPLLALDCAFSLTNTSWSLFLPMSGMILFYYSLFQISTVSRNRMFLALYNAVNNIKTFIVYILLVSIAVLCFIVFNIYMAYLDLGVCPNTLQILSKFIVLKFMLLSVIPGFLPVVSYSIAAVYVLYTRFYGGKKFNYSNKQEMTRFRRSFRLLVKFWLMASIVALNSVLVNVYFYLSMVLLINTTIVNFIGDLGFAIYAIQPLFLIYIHSILKNTLKDIFLNFLNFFRKR